MQGINRVFGIKPKEVEVQKVSLGEASDKMTERGDGIDKKIADCDAELAKLKPQMAAQRGNAALKKKALMILKRKKMYEQQRGQLSGMQMNVDSIAFATESMETTVQTVEAMKQACSALKTQMGAINLDKVESMQEDFADMMMDQEEIQDVLGRNYAMDGLDEGELELEYASLEEEMAFESMEAAPGAPTAAPSYLPTAAPVADPSAPLAVDPSAGPAYL